VIGHARQRNEVDWLQFANWSSVQFSSSAVNTPLLSRVFFLIFCNPNLFAHAPRLKRKTDFTLSSAAAATASVALSRMRMRHGMHRTCELFLVPLRTKEIVTRKTNQYRPNNGKTVCPDDG